MAKPVYHAKCKPGTKETFRSLFSGATCSICQGKIEKGDFIGWQRRGRVEFPHETLTPERPADIAETPTMEHPAMKLETPAELLTKAAEQASAEKTLADAIKAIAGSAVSESKVREIAQEVALEAVEAGLVSEADIRKMVEDITPKPLTVEVKQPDKPTVTLKNAHFQLPKLLALLAKRRNVYLWGAPGSGKSTAAQQCAEALNLPFAYISLNQYTTDSRINGFIDAHGVYSESQFYKLYRDGGVYCIDEMDNASANVLTALNSALESKLAAFPCGMVEKHPDFMVVACGNTNGRGANPQFPDRRPFDSAFTERFLFVKWEYDSNLEETVTLARNPKARPWLKWVRDIREYAKIAYPKLVVSPRASYLGADLFSDKAFTLAEVAEMTVFKGHDKDTVDRILAAVPLPSREVF